MAGRQGPSGGGLAARAERRGFGGTGRAEDSRRAGDPGRRRPRVMSRPFPVAVNGSAFPSVRGRRIRCRRAAETRSTLARPGSSALVSGLCDGQWPAATATDPLLGASRPVALESRPARPRHAAQEPPTTRGAGLVRATLPRTVTSDASTPASTRIRRLAVLGPRLSGPRVKPEPRRDPRHCARFGVPPDRPDAHRREDPSPRPLEPSRHVPRFSRPARAPSA